MAKARYTVTDKYSSGHPKEQIYTIEENKWITEKYEKGIDGTLLTDLFYRRFASDMTDEKNENTPMSWYFTATKK
jgi:hypothetical protein